MRFALLLLVLTPAAFAVKKKASAPAAETPLERYMSDARARSSETASHTPGAIWAAGSRLTDTARDLRASQLDDLLTIQVVENASAVAKGTVKTQRTSSAKASVSSIAGITKATGALANLANLSGDKQLDGQGATSRDVVISTTITARVAAVMPNGGLIVEAAKDVEVNGERQTIIVRGVVRPNDIAGDNTIRSDRLGQLEVRVNGKGVVGDAIKRPFILYRILMGLLPF